MASDDDGKAAVAPTMLAALVQQLLAWRRRR
jgi:hypothetical protein